jgi:hypothetical protein
MHGLEQIKSMNEDPSGYHRSREPQHHGHPKEERATSSTNSSRTDAILDDILNDFVGGKRETAATKTAELFGEMIANAIILEALGIERPDTYAEAERLVRSLTGEPPKTQPAPQPQPKPNYTHQDGVDFAIEGNPFVKFWRKLNDNRVARGLPELMYGEAKRSFEGGATPDGAITFVGGDWNGLRAVPVNSTDDKRTYHGEFRETTAEGNMVWRRVHNEYGPIAFKTAEAALHGANRAKLLAAVRGKKS